MVGVAVLVAGAALTVIGAIMTANAIINWEQEIFRNHPAYVCNDATNKLITDLKCGGGPAAIIGEQLEIMFWLLDDDSE